MAKSKFSFEIQQLIEKRAGGRCEYCKAPVAFMPHSFTIDHVIPLILGGTNELINLACACFKCNRCKYHKIRAVDPFTQKESPLYNPRTQDWKSHFAWDSTFTKILGLTAVGRATVEALQLNRPQLIRMRKELIEVNRHPPVEN